MNLEEFKNQFICGELGIPKDYGRIFSFIDFSNVNKWFENDNQGLNNKLLTADDKLAIDLQKLKSFADIFSTRSRIYYGEDPKSSRSLSFTYVMREIFGKRNMVTKDLQRIRHYVGLDNVDIIKTVVANEDGRNYVEVRKCNFDVEISVDAIKMINHYEIFCIFSGDADFVYLNNFLRKMGKKIIVIKGGYVTAKLKESANLVINAQDIKKYIIRVIKKQRPD